MRSLLLSPHCDDEILFAAFTILKHRPEVYICFGSSGDYGSEAERMQESRRALAVLIGGIDVHRLDPTATIVAALTALDVSANPDIVWAPAGMASHRDHLRLHHDAGIVFGHRLRTYETYVLDDAGAPVKVRGRTRAPIDDRAWVARKLKALAEFTSQITHPRASVFFQWDLQEFAEQP